MRSMNPTILAIFAHPDDDALTCMGTLAKFAREHYQVYVLTLTAGDRSNTAVEMIRLSEAQSVSQLVGYSLIQQSMPDGQLKFDIGTISLIERYIQQLRPQVVITHYPQARGYGHQDHDTVADAVVNAARRSSCVECILYAEPPVQNWGFSPNFFVDVTDYMELKKQAIARHHSESAKPYMLPDIAEMRGSWWALQNHPESFCVGRYLEPFVLVKGLLGQDTFITSDSAFNEADDLTVLPALLPALGTSAK